MKNAGYYVIDEPIGTGRAMVDRPVRVIVVVDETPSLVRAMLADVLRSDPVPDSPDPMRALPAHRRTQAFIRARNDWRNDRRARGRKR